MKMTDTKNPMGRMASSFCPNCGDVVKWEVSEDDKTRNRIPCTGCTKHLAAMIDADQILEGAGIEVSRIQQIEAERSMRVAIDALRARRRNVVVAHSDAIRKN